MAVKVATLAQRKQLFETVIVTDGLSDNKFFTSLLSDKLGTTVIPMGKGRFAGAYGAALLARERL